MYTKLPRSITKVQTWKIH